MMSTPPTSSLPGMGSMLEEHSTHNNDSDSDSIVSLVLPTNAPSTHIVITKYISDDALYVVLNVVMVTLCGSASVLGILANIINIIVFVRQGVFSESSNVSLMGLSVADLLCVLSMFWGSITYAIALHKPPNLIWEPFDFFYISGAWPRVITGLITRVVTAFVALERCVCVVFPFKVKSIFTPKFSFIAMVSIFTYFIISYSPAFYYNQFQFIPDPETNVTFYRLVTLPGFTRFDAIVSYINLFSITFASVAIVLICTMITVSRVKMSRAWRESCATSGNTTKPEDSKEDSSSGGGGGGATQQNKMSASRMRKEKKLINMISFISIIFLICYIPNLTITIMYGINDQITTKGDYQNLAWTMFSFIFLSETINSSINIIVYYKMSSRFKQECNLLFGKGEIAE